jgi:hypothetical protein
MMMFASSKNPTIAIEASFLETTYATERLWINQAIQVCLNDYWTMQQAQYPTLNQTLPELETLWQALAHATVLGGKRIRPLLALETYRAFAPQQSAETCFEVMQGACCATMIYAEGNLLFIKRLMKQPQYWWAMPWLV